MSRMSDFDRDHVGYVLSEGTWLTADLFRLIIKADPENRERIRQAFPEEVAAVEAWEQDPPQATPLADRSDA